MTFLHRNVYFLSTLVLCLLCPSQPSLSHWDLKLQLQQQHFPHLIFFHIPIPRLYEVTTDETKTYSVKTVTDCSRLLIAIRDIDKTSRSLSDTCVQFCVLVLFQIHRCSASFSCWRQLPPAPESIIVLKWSNTLHSVNLSDRMSVLSNLTYIFSLLYPYWKTILLYGTFLQGFLFCFAASSHLIGIIISPTERDIKS